MAACIKTSVLGKGAFGHVTGIEGEGNAGGIALKSVVFNRTFGRTEFENEVRLMDMLRGHPNIVTYKQHGLITDQSAGWISMEWCRSGSLDRYMRKLRDAGPVSEATICGVLAQVCAAVQHMHRMGVMHRDIKPVNIFVCSDGTVKLGDFGLATDHQLSRDNVGTRGFCSPEVGDGYYGKEVDIWSLGCLAFWLVSDRMPFQEISLPSVFQQGGSDYDEYNDIDWWTYDRPVLQCSSKLVKLIDRLLQERPGQRPTIDTFVERLAHMQMPRSTWWSFSCFPTSSSPSRVDQ